MSQSYQVWLKNTANEILGINAKERAVMEEKPHIFCTYAEREIREHAGNELDPMMLFDKMPEEQKRQLACKTINDALIFLGFRRKLKNIQEREEEEQVMAFKVPN